MALAALLLWPSAEPEGPPPESLTVGSWPARGSLVDDVGLVDSAETAWRSASASGSLDPPGRDVRALYAGALDGPVVAALSSVDPLGREVVATLVDAGSGWRVIDVESPRTTDPVPGLTLPSGEGPRVLLAPEIAGASAATVVRREDSLWTPLPVGADGVTAPVPSGPDGSDPTIGLRSSDGLRGGLRGVFSVSIAAIFPITAPVIVDDPRWGRGGVSLTTAEYDAAYYADPVVPEGNGRIAVLAHDRVPGGRVVIVETQSATAGWYSHLLVVPGPDGEATLGPAPVVDGDLAAAVAPRAGGRVQVLAAAAPAISSIEVRDEDDVLVEGIGSTAVVLAPPLPPQVQVLAKGVDGAVVARLVLPLAERAGAGPQ